MYYLGNARSDAQSRYMQQLAADGVCIFCHPDQEVLHRTAHWTVIPNRYPYRGTTLHLMMIPQKHVTDLLDLSEPARQDLWPALDWVRQRHDLRYYGLGARNGDCQYTGGTIAHVHVHLIVGNPSRDPVRFTMS